MNVKPIEAGISVNFAIAEGLMFKEQDLRINLDEYKEELVRSFERALALATEGCGYMTSETVKLLLVKAQQQASIAGSQKQDTSHLRLQALDCQESKCKLRP